MLQIVFGIFGKLVNLKKELLMFVVSFCEQNILFGLHKKVGDKFETYSFTTDGDRITGAQPAVPLNELTIYGYVSKVNDSISRNNNMYYGDHFAVMEVDDKAYEHLMAQWGTASSTLKNGLIFGEKKQADAIAKAKARVAGGGLASLDTGSRPLAINYAYQSSLRAPLPEHKKIHASDMVS